jgi:hypothetical protein
MRESTIERYLHAQVVKHGGTTRKFSSTHRPNNPDRIVIWPSIKPGGAASVHFVELKAENKKPRRGQQREMNRLRKLGCSVYVFDCKQSINTYASCWSAGLSVVEGLKRVNETLGRMVWRAAKPGKALQGITR